MDEPRLEHVRVNVSDFRRAVAWYEGILGLTAQSYWPPQEPKYAHFQTGPTQFAISEIDPVPAAGRTTSASGTWTLGGNRSETALK